MMRLSQSGNLSEIRHVGYYFILCQLTWSESTARDRGLETDKGVFLIYLFTDKSHSLSDLNRLIMDYLVIEGYKDAAERFSSESGLSPQVDLESIENRMNIRSAIQRGDVEDAIGRVNELDPEVSCMSMYVFVAVREGDGKKLGDEVVAARQDDTFTCTTPRLPSLCRLCYT